MRSMKNSSSSISSSLSPSSDAPVGGSVERPRVADGFKMDVFAGVVCCVVFGEGAGFAGDLREEGVRNSRSEDVSAPEYVAADCNIILFRRLDEGDFGGGLRPLFVRTSVKSGSPDSS